ncbi:MAG: F0F1 ATP synthase subunit delta [Candidatus Competibacteraceae bacterium]|nr:F0F1 ATP synthase subunit delta [Candidatus Competibacteraceae bacterium]
MQRDRLAEVSAAAAAETVGHLLSQIGGPDLHSALIRAACQQLGSLPQGALPPVTVESAEPLSPEHLGVLRNTLGTATDAANFKTVKGLGAGIRISTGKGLIDASVRGLTQFARQALVKAMNHRENNRNPLQSANDV